MKIALAMEEPDDRRLRCAEILRRMVSGMGAGRTSPGVDEDELVQRALVRAFAHSELSSLSERELIVYLRGVAVQVVHEAKRAGASTTATPFDLVRFQDWWRYQEALTKLSDQESHAVIMRLEMGYGYEEIAGILDLPDATAAREVIARAYLNLATHMARSRGT